MRNGDAKKNRWKTIRGRFENKNVESYDLLLRDMYVRPFFVAALEPAPPYHGLFAAQWR